LHACHFKKSLDCSGSEQGDDSDVCV